MGRSFYDFGDIKIPKTETKKENNTKIEEQNYQDIYEKYNKMPQDELMTNLFKEVSKQKQNGTFDIQKLETAVDNLGGMLNNEQKKNIKELLNKIR